jgi:hypothetical protein
VRSHDYGNSLSYEEAADLLREAGALVIRRDENGEWPDEVVIAMREAIGGYAWNNLGSPTDPFDATTAARLALDALSDRSDRP